MVISIFEFLKKYYGQELDPRTYLNHKTAKRKYRLKFCPFRYATENPELINSGTIIYVRDTYGVIIPYICPKKIPIVNDTTSKIDDIKKLECYKEILEELTNMPTYMVRQLLSEYKYIPSFYKSIKKELKHRGVYDNKIHRLKKEILGNELEESDLNDKYQRRRKIKCKKP